jgi:hypothetical protein
VYSASRARAALSTWTQHLLRMVQTRARAEVKENTMDNDHVDQHFLRGIPESSSQTVMCKPRSGILNQRKYLPIRFMPITISLCAVDDLADAVV